MAKTTLRAVIEKYRFRLKESRHQKAARKLLLLAEDDPGMSAMMDLPVDAPSDEASGNDAVDTAFKQLMHAQLDKLLDDSHTLADFLSNIRELYKTRAKVTGKGSDSQGGSAEDTVDNEEYASQEARRAINSQAILEAAEACDGAGFRPDRADLELVAATPAARRRILIERLKKTAQAHLPLEARGGSGPQSTGKSRIDPALTAGSGGNKLTQESQPPADAKAFAKFVSE